MNSKKKPSEWGPDIAKSVTEYDNWYLSNSPSMFTEARERAILDVKEAMNLTNNFQELDATALLTRPAILFVARMSVSPPMARDRFVGFSGANKSMVTAMEREGVLPVRGDTTAQLQKMCDFLLPLLDPSVFPWIGAGRKPTPSERGKALLVVGERLASAYYLPVLRNSQEARQKKLLRRYLRRNDFTESNALPFEMPTGSFRFGRNVPAVREDGEKQNIPVDCVIAPKKSSLPLVCLELKSAGDFTNVNKRRKEESDKHNAIQRTYGTKAVFLLQLFGYFEKSYLGFEAAAGIDWAWDHRLGDLASYFGLSGS